ncbi:MAG: T9SS type A sorting domain-containing protein [Bacteroidales bacterium]|nr:T9SS type A sorting domain-containing protein [Bacteroidales bacterium]
MKKNVCKVMFNFGSSHFTGNITEKSCLSCLIQECLPGKMFFTVLFIIFGFTIAAQNNALDFDGTDDHVEVPDNNSLDIINSITIEAWVNVVGGSTNGPRILSKMWEGPYELLVKLDGGTSTCMLILHDCNNVGHYCEGGTDIANGEWHHIAGTWDGSTMHVYTDGNLDDLYSSSFTGTLLSTTDDVYIGSQNSYYDFFEGKIDEVRLWNDARTEAEIRANMYREIPNPTSETNLVAYYKFNETSGTTADNAEGTPALDGTLNNMTNDDWVTSAAFTGPKNCLDFDESDDYVEVPADPSQDITDAITIEAWVKPGSANHYQNILEKGSYYDDAYALLVKQDIQYIKFSLIGIDQHWGYGPVNLWDGKWHHIAGTYDKNGGSNNTNLYVDGYCVKFETNTGSITSDPLEKIYIGGHSYDGNLFNGPIDEVRLWNIARTAEQIRENMCKTLTGNESGLVTYYNFDNTSGTVLQDFSGNENDGTLTNMDPATDWVSSSTFNTWLNVTNSTWSTATNWSRGSAPVSTDNVGIVNYQGGTSPIISGSVTCNNLCIGLSAALTINPGNDLSVDENLFNNGGTTGLVIKSDATGTGSLIESSGVDATVERYYTGGEWHFISSPISNAKAGMFSGMYLQSHDETSNNYSDVTLTTDPLNVMQGYALYNSNTATAQFSGILNTGAVGSANNVTRNGLGWNLVGNPYPSSLDWDAASGWTKTNVENATYIHVNNATWAEYVGGVGANGGTRYIAPEQGFFVRVSAGQTLGTLNMNKNVRVHNATIFFKDEVADIVRLEVTGNGYTDETVIRFLEEATPQFDGNWDAHKLFGTVAEAPQIYSTANEFMAINSLPETEIVPVDVKAGVSGVFTISATETSEFETVILEDVYTGKTTDLNNNTYTYTYNVSDENRFIVHFSPLGVDEPEKAPVNIYSYNKDIYVTVPGGTKGDIVVYNIMGQEIANAPINSALSKVTLNKSGNYIVKVLSKQSVVSRKVFIK